jgi:hypothetical protein
MPGFTYARKSGNVLIAYKPNASAQIGVMKATESAAKYYPQAGATGATIPESSLDTGDTYVIGAYPDTTKGPIDTDRYVCKPGSKVMLTGAKAGWRNLPEFKAINPTDQGMFTDFADTGNQAMTSGARDTSCASIVGSDTFKDANLLPTLIACLHMAPDQLFGPMSTFITTNASYTSPNLDRMADKDVGNAKKRLMRIIATIGSEYSKMSGPAQKILANTLDAYTTGASIKLVLVDDSDKQVHDFPNVGDLYYGGGLVGLNTVGFGITPDSVNLTTNLAATAAHAFGHSLREAQVGSTAKGSFEHWVDEIFCYYTEFVVTYQSQGMPSGTAMEKATTQLQQGPYTYNQATGAIAAKIKDATTTMTSNANTAAPSPTNIDAQFENWSFLNDK